VSPFDVRVCDVKFFDRQALDMDKAQERKVETIFFREDLRRVSYDDVGRIFETQRVGEQYSEAFLAEVARRKEIAEAKPKIVVNYSHGTPAQFLPQLLNTLGVEAVAVNGVVSENIGSRSFEEFQEEQRQLAVLVPALGASLGVIVDAGGEKIFVVDDRGRVINDMHFLATFVSLTVRQAPGVIAVPVYAPSSIEQIVAAQGGRVQRVRASAEAQMSLAAREHPLLVGDGVGGFIFPRFHPSFDGLFATVRLIELLVVAKQTLSEVLDQTPPVHLARLQVVCPWEEKGRVMRMLAQDPQTERTRQIDGVKHQSDGEWILVLPDADRPLFNVYAEAKDDARAWVLVQEYADKLERMRAS
jgi:mannose-1-phosphate guanylyltransferase/phosphomannomutase